MTKKLSILGLILVLSFLPLCAEYNVICYTTTDGKPLYPYNSSQIDGTIIQNTYESEKGLIEFTPLSGNNITNIGSYSFYEPTINSFFDPKNGSSIVVIGDYPYPKEGEENYHRLRSIELPTGIEKIGDYAFANNSSLQTISLPSSINYIGSSAFLRDTSLTVFPIPFPNQSVKNYTFADCHNLTSIDLSNVTECIGKGAFLRCFSISSITIPEGVSRIEEYAFNYCGAKTIQLPSTIDSICTGSFNGSAIDSIDFPDGIKTIPFFCFGFSSLHHFKVPSTVTILETSSFECCYNLETIEIPTSVTYIGSYTFANCPSLVAINYKGTKQQWNDITKKTDWRRGGWRSTPLEVVHCIDGDIRITPYIINEATRGNLILEMNNSEWATVCVPFDSSLPSGFKAYTISNADLETGKLTLKSSKQVYKNKPYLVHGTSPYYILTGKLFDETNTSSLNNGLLKGTYDTIRVNEGDYVLQNQQGKVGFYRVTDNTEIWLSPNKAFLRLPSGTENLANSFSFVEENNNLSTPKENKSIQAIYNASGQRISDYHRGFNIIEYSNGEKKKIIIR